MLKQNCSINYGTLVLKAGCISNRWRVYLNDQCHPLRNLFNWFALGSGHRLFKASHVILRSM